MVEIPPHLHGGLSDSAGQPWEGRTFSDNPWQNDDGTAPKELGEALENFRAGSGTPVEVVDALRETRLLVPLVAELGDEGENDQGVKVDKSAELSIVTVKAPDGRGVVPVFSSVEAMKRWDETARPIPVDSRRAALAAVEERNDLLILDPGSPDTEFVVRRPAVWAISQATGYELPWRDPRVLEHAQGLLAAEPRLLGIDLVPGDPGARFAGPELVIALHISADLDESQQQSVLQTVQASLAGNTDLVERVDSLALRVDRVESSAGAGAEQTRRKTRLFRRRRAR
ncbi:SseB family protein [Gulosibacter molinativorax]|uniref:SseB family protein n=1 Tax=Gulosibacter molinativorax TaxID=256821 RepID=UPI00041FB05B|nr:SseB family protein [Gulosibacter molinativorax]QUY61069.1 Hypotetical protein [Gulosibacter molinativorax]